MKRFFVGTAAIAALAGFYACDNGAQSHVYVASLYDGTACFGPSLSLGVIDTPTGDLDCAPTCLASTTATGQSLIYVSTMCGPYPVELDTSGTNPGCAGALASWQSAGGPGTCAGAEDAGAEAGGDGSASEDGGTDDSATDATTSGDAGDDGGAPADASDAGTG
jgi:hypothetical protein